MVEPKDIPAPGYCTADGVMLWHCDRCGQARRIVERFCGNCGLGRSPQLEPWAELFERMLRLSSGMLPPRPPQLPRSEPPAATVEPPAPAEPAHSPAYQRFLRSMKLPHEGWGQAEEYDVRALAEIHDWERPQVLEMLQAREITWREVRALDALPLPQVVPLLEEASRAYLSASARLLAADALHRRGKLDRPIDEFLAQETRQLHQPDDACRHALELARKYPTHRVKQALLYASCLMADSAPPCAALLCELCGKAAGEDDPRIAPILSKLGLHQSSYNRQAGFAALCTYVGMALDTSY